MRLPFLWDFDSAADLHMSLRPIVSTWPSISRTMSFPMLCLRGWLQLRHGDACCAACYLDGPTVRDSSTYAPWRHPISRRPYCGIVRAADLAALPFSRRCSGLGVGLVYIPATAVISQWFHKRRSLANGISSAGSGVGGLILCFANGFLTKGVGYAWALRITAFIALAINLLAIVLFRSRNTVIQPNQKMFDIALLRCYHINLLLAWGFVSTFGYITLAFSLADYAKIIGRSDSDAATVAVMLNLGTAVGRPLVGYVSDRFGRFEVTTILTLVTGILCFALWIQQPRTGCLSFMP